MAKNWALEFNAVDINYVNLGQDPSLIGVFDPGSKWTIDMWIYPQALPISSWSWLFCKAFTSHSPPYYQFDIRYYRIAVPEIGINVNSIVGMIWQADIVGIYLISSSPTNSISLNNWYPIEIDVDLTIPYLELFLGGVSQGKDDTPEGSYSNYDSPVSLGIDLNILTSNYAFSGIIDEVRVSDDIRHTSNFTPPTRKYSSDADTRGLWHLDEGSGLIVYDLSSYGNDGDIYGASYVPGAPLLYGLPAPIGRGLAGKQILRGVAR